MKKKIIFIFIIMLLIIPNVFSLTNIWELYFRDGTTRINGTDICVDYPLGPCFSDFSGSTYTDKDAIDAVNISGSSYNISVPCSLITGSPDTDFCTDASGSGATGFTETGLGLYNTTNTLYLNWTLINESTDNRATASTTYSNTSWDTSQIPNGADYYDGINVNSSISFYDLLIRTSILGNYTYLNNIINAVNTTNNINDLFADDLNVDLNTEYINTSFDTSEIPNGADYYNGIQVNESFKTVFYNVTNITMVRGITLGGLQDINEYNGNSFNITEQSGAIGLDVIFNLTIVPKMNQIVFRYKTTSGETHQTILYLWNYEENDWESYGTESEITDFTVFTFPVFDSNIHIRDGVVSIRVLSSSNGNTGHTHYFDWVTVSNGIATPSSSESDPFALHKSGDTPLEGNWSIGGFTIFGGYYNGWWSGNTTQNVNDLFTSNNLAVPSINATIFIPEIQIIDLQPYTKNSTDLKTLSINTSNTNITNIDEVNWDNGAYTETNTTCLKIWMGSAYIAVGAAC